MFKGTLSFEQNKTLLGRHGKIRIGYVNVYKRQRIIFKPCQFNMDCNTVSMSYYGVDLFTNSSARVVW